MANRPGQDQSKAYACLCLCRTTFTMCFVSYRVVLNFFLFRPSLAHASYSHVPCHAVPKKKSPISFFFKSACQVVHIFFFKSMYFFFRSMPLFKFNRIENSKLKSIFNNNKLIIVREYNINY